MRILFTLMGISGIGLVVFFTDFFQNDKYTLDQSVFKVSGTSTIQDWETVSRTATGEAEI